MPISPSQPNKRGQSTTARIGTLATLPVFFDLKGKPVLLIGGTEAATWKAELLAATGAKVEVHALEFCDEMHSLAARTDLNGSVALICQPWSIKAFGGQSLVVGDAETEGEAKAIYCAARAAGVPVNVIDKPAFCTFKFGTIVNRSPVVIGISTDGAAPVLGQAIRTRIEALLPQALSQWASYAKEIRETVLRKFSAGPQRRAFWAQFAQAAFGPFAPHDLWQNQVDAVPRVRSGSVTVLPVPNSDPGLLTLNEVRQLQSADAIYFETNVELTILDHARREAARCEIKQLSHASIPFINLIETMRQSIANGQNIVFVKPHGDASSLMLGQIIYALEILDIDVNQSHMTPASPLQSADRFRHKTSRKSTIKNALNA